MTTSEAGRKNLFFERLKNKAAAPEKRNTDTFDCNTNLDVKTYQGSMATKNAVRRLISFLFVTPKAAKYAKRTVNTPIRTCGNLIANSFNPKSAIKGTVRYILRVVG